MPKREDHMAVIEEAIGAASMDGDLSAQEFIGLMEQVADHADAQATACRDAMAL